MLAMRGCLRVGPPRTRSPRACSARPPGETFLLRSKPLTYAIALDELGADMVHQYVGQEPSGRMFNELVLDHNSE
jgi:hypothetical protein